ncbi:Uncharacterised protein [Legionella beliardensis]|uniref:Uncharacterized protein n=1 Tax=Legionella beliardensis TaxID=91822 RepID=A0A378HZZ5_9GAMM|nr:hypothetical protein [Legionella beliardensis]STX27965.1 Uncharacterised protein [Legionella beliardensis]
MKFQLMQLDKILNLQQPRKNFKEHERGRLNPALTPIEHLEELHEDIPYIWAIDREGNVIVGLEKPWAYPHAFGYEGDEPLWQEIKKQLLLENEKWNYGHPTLTPLYNENGEIISSDTSELAFLGGELVYKDDIWIINNKSGRFRNTLNKDNELASPEIIEQILTHIAEKLKESNLVEDITTALYSKQTVALPVVNEQEKLKVVAALTHYLDLYQPAKLLKKVKMFDDNKDCEIVRQALARLEKNIDNGVVETIAFLSQTSSERKISSKLEDLLDELKSLQTEPTQPEFINR